MLFRSLVEGVQGALWALGGVPQVLRSDNLSAATYELSSGGRELTKRYQKFLTYYGLRSTRIRPGESHENGVVEKAHDVLKGALEQALLVRGSRDFADEAAYDQFVQETAQRVRNRHVAEALGQEQELLRRLPGAPLATYTTYQSTVRKWSTIQVGGRTYSVPSRLIGQEVEARQYAQRVEVYYRGRLVETMPRLRGEQAHRIDYRHVIWSLVRKPGAFARYRFREDLFPSLVFRRAYDALRQSHGERADVEYLRLLHLAASTLQGLVERVLEAQLAKGGAWDYQSVRAQADPVAPPVPQVAVPAPDLRHYDAQRRQLVIQRPLFHVNTRRVLEPWQVILLVDQSGSMLPSVIHAAVTAACLWGLPGVQTHLIAFDTEVVDLTEHVDDPVAVLMGVQLGGGTFIGKAVAYAAEQVKVPRRAIVVIVSDFYEGMAEHVLVGQVRALVAQGSTVLGLAALDENADPVYDRELAARLVEAGAHVGAMTPGQLAAWLAEKLQ